MKKESISRRDFMKFTLGASAFVYLPSLARAENQSTTGDNKPNVIFCFSDEHRWHSMSFTEMPELITPNMSLLASQGVSFNNAISNYPLCSPCRAMIMTGLWPYQQRMSDGSDGMIDNDLRLSSDQMTIGKAFRKAGYNTGYIGKWHLGGKSAADFGFDESLVWINTNDHWDSKYITKNGDTKSCYRYNTNVMTNQALDFIDSSAKKPFFLMLSFDTPHSNFTDAPDDKMKLYKDPDSLSYRKNFIRGKNWENFNEKYQGYHAHISAVDDELGRIMKKLDRLGISENTILVYSSDHGSMFGSHRLLHKRQPYEESIKVPFIVRWPKVVPAGVKTDALLGSIDIMPTLLSLAGITIPDTCSGKDLSGVVLGTGGATPKSQFIMHISNTNENVDQGDGRVAMLFRGVRTGQYTLAIYHDQQSLLFDNKNDPYQMNNLYDDPSMSDVRKELKNELSQWLTKAKDPFKL